MAVTYKDIDQLSKKSSVSGTEKIPVSDTEYITPSQINEAVSRTSTPSHDSTTLFTAGGALKYCIITEPLTPSETVEDKYLKTDGTESSAANYNYRKYPVDPGKTYLFTASFHTGYTTGNIRAVLWLDENDNVLSYETYANKNSSAVTYYDVPVVAPSGAAYLVLNYREPYSISGVVKVASPLDPRILLKVAQTLTSAEQEQVRTNIGVPNITVSSSEPTASDGSDGDIWIVV